jgi:hypothetical protein
MLRKADATPTRPDSAYILDMKKKDIYDGEPWTEMAIRDLRAEIEHGSTIEEAAGHLCRSGTVDDVKRKAAELGLKWQHDADRN